MPRGFGALTEVASPNIVLDELRDVGPPEVPGKEFKGLETTVVSGRRVIVRLGENVRLEVLVVRDVDEAVV